MKRTVAIQDVHYVHGKPRHNQVLHVYHNWTDEELADEANVVRQNNIEFRRLKRFIESYDEIMEMLRNAASDMHQVFSALSRSNIQDAFELTNEMDALIDRIDGEEAI